MFSSNIQQYKTYVILDVFLEDPFPKSFPDLKNNKTSYFNADSQLKKYEVYVEKI